MTSPSNPNSSDVLAIRPFRARDDEHDPEGLASIRVPRFDGRFLGRWLMPRLKHPHFVLRLDAVGTQVWDLCDGTLTGREIADRLRERFPDLQDVDGRVSVFLGHLLAQGHIRPTQGSPGTP